MIVPWTWGALTTRGRTQPVHMVALTMCHVSRYRLCMMILLSICRAIGSDGPLPRECEIQVQWPAAHCVLHHVNLRFSKALAHGDFHLYRHTHKHTHMTEIQATFTSNRQVLHQVPKLVSRSGARPQEKAAYLGNVLWIVMTYVTYRLCVGLSNNYYSKGCLGYSLVFVATKRPHYNPTRRL